jgi:alkanesulfonate monooxygenase SsuD/methylene tetrahydromethanopterin reductase-like flavin-dependent oxidoreductase (luciferase family)
MTSVKLGANCWGQYTDWPTLREAGMRADRLGFDSLWTWDHLYPIVGSHEGPIFEGWLTLAAWAEATERATVGLMVGANTFRNPAVVAKMVTALDHISGGRAVLGIGGAWFETEHRGLGIEFGSSPGERLRWLDEAVRIMRGMLRGERPSGSRH